MGRASPDATPRVSRRLPLARVLALCAALLLACSLLVAPVRAALAQDESATEEASGDGAANFTDPQNGAEGGEEEQTPDEEDGGGVLDKVGGFLKDVALAPGKAAGDLAASGIEAVGVKTFLTLLEMFINDVLLAGIEQASEALTRSAFSLPPPEGKLVQEYDKLMELVRPAVLIGILLLGGLMMAQSANYNAAYAAQYGLPKLFFVALTLVFFPDFMTFVSDVSGSLSEGMMSQADVGGALKNLLAKTVTGNLTGMGILMFFAWIAIFCMIFLVMAVAILKNILFALLFILGPLAIISYPIPGLSAVAGAWFRGIMACALIPLAFTMEIMVGSWIIESPELVFGPAGEILPIFTALAVVILLWIMWKTPFSVMGWAFQSASVSGLSGTLNPVAAAGRGARSAAGVAASIGKSVAVRRIAGGPAGGASAKGAPLAKGADLDKGAPGRPSGQRPGPSQARFNRSQRNATARQVTTAVKNVATLNNLRGGGGPSGTGASGGTSRPNNAFPTRASASRSGGGRKPNSGPAGDAGSRGAKRAGPTKD